MVTATDSHTKQNKLTPLMIARLKTLKIGEIDYFTLDFSSYLNEVSGDTIASFTVDDGQGAEGNAKRTGRQQYNPRGQRDNQRISAGKGYGYLFA